MGNGNSKPEQHVFNADAPVQFSQSAINALQRSPESDSTRARANDLKVQNRVTEELTRLRDTQSKQLSDITASLTTDAPSKEEPARDPHTLAAHLSSPFYQDHSGGNPVASPKADSGRSSESVTAEIASLKAKLDSRKKVDRASPEVEKAKEALATCLRTNDRRPLDCWEEVETFKREVGKLEMAFIQKTGR
ncbi:micos complex subunit mic19 [Acrodontium crateriforme]|uniref:Micos complex subunit mic19 n=1 Tax=Acrodontium crateriforme TaxID=150365 RepID=A0AAQ3R982_9PEZI|nr:micos complex subunit mic19 [Acrodontium crateriforme]